VESPTVHEDWDRNIPI